MASLVAQRLKRLPAKWETQVRALGQEDPLGESMATHSSILAWRISWTEQPGTLQSMGSQRVEHNRATKHTYIIYPNKNRKELREELTYARSREVRRGKLFTDRNSQNVKAKRDYL